MKKKVRNKNRFLKKEKYTEPKKKSLHYLFNQYLALMAVFSNNIATVIGPTPPGTGVIKEATSFAFSYSTSPTQRTPDFFEASKRKI